MRVPRSFNFPRSVITGYVHGSLLLTPMYRLYRGACVSGISPIKSLTMQSDMCRLKIYRPVKRSRIRCPTRTKKFFFLFLQGCKKLLIVLEPFESVNKIWQKTCCYKLEILYDFVHLLCIFYCGVQKHESTGVFDELQYLTGETKSCAISIKINFIL